MKPAMLASALLATAALLGGCGGGAGGEASARPQDTRQLCVSSNCGERVVLLDIPGAENQIFTDDGRLFVSSGSGVYEITKNADGSYAKQLVNNDCGFNGLAIRGGTLYAACGSGPFYAGAITPAPVTLTKIFDVAGMCISNGMATGPDGNLYLVDEPLNCVPDPKIVRLNVDPADPLHVVSQEVWVQGSPLGLLFLGQNNVLRFPNGLVRQGNTFFGTDGGSVYRVDWQVDGSAGEVTPLFFEPTPHDDLGVAGDALVIADFAGGRLLLVSQAGELLQQTDRLLFSFPSSARLGRPPMFETTDIVVTETGVLGDQSLPLDHLSVFRRRKQ